MCEYDTTLPALSPEEKEKNKQYSLRDTTGQLHTFKAGEADMTEEWIALLRRDENELRTLDFRYYYKWNGKMYVRMIYRSDDISPAELEHYSTMHDESADVERTVVERESEKLSHDQYLAAMAAMTDRQKDLIHKLFVLGMTKTDIARDEGVPATAIQRRWEKICRKVRKFFT